MPMSVLFPGDAHRLPSRSPANSRNQQKLYFSPGGHTHDRHTIPFDRLHISLSDPVLVAAEQCLSDSVLDDKRCCKNIPKLESPVFDGFLSQRSGAAPLTMATITSPELDLSWMSGFQGITEHGSLDSCDISDVVTVPTAINGLSGDPHCSASENSRYGPSLAPLASETFKQELYDRGYLKRPASRSSNLVPRKSRISFLLGSRKIFPKVLGQRQGHKVATCLKAEQDTVEIPSDHDEHLSENQNQLSPSVGLVTLRTPHADNLESPWVDTNTSASVSDSFDLHEFSYITAFTTPPSSPSIVLDAETFRKGVDLEREHAV